jgi:DNA-binding MarR family transcriptional regulator
VRHSPGSVSREDVAAALEQASILTTRHITDQAALSLTAALTLSRLNKQGPIRLTTLAAAEGISQPSMTQLIQRLERQGLATRINDPEDGRVALVSITNAGRALLNARQRAPRPTGRAARGPLARGRGGAEPGRAGGAAHHPPTRRRRHHSVAQPDSKNRVINQLRRWVSRVGIVARAIAQR